MNDAAINLALKFIDQATAPMGRSMKAIQQQTAAVERVMNSAARAVKAFFVGFVVHKITSFVHDILELASSFDQMKISLDTVTQGKGEETFKRLNEWALRMPVSTEQAIQGYISLRARGLDPTIAQMTTLVDTYNALGGGKERFTGIIKAMGDIASKGKLAAQELNQLAEWGIPARDILAKAFGVTTQKLMEMAEKGISAKSALEALWQGMEQRYGGQSAKVMQKYAGIIETIVSYGKEFARLTMDSGAMRQVESDLARLVSSLDELKERGKLDEWAEQMGEALQGLAASLGLVGGDAEKTGQQIVDFLAATVKGATEVNAAAIPVMKNLVGIIVSLFNAFNLFPDEVKGAAGVGIVFRILGGSWTMAAVIATVDTLNASMERLNQTFSNIKLPSAQEIGRTWDEYLGTVQKIQQVISGLRDWNTGEWTGPQPTGNIIRKQIPLPSSAPPEPIKTIVPEMIGKTKASTRAAPVPLALSDIDQQLDSLKSKVESMRESLADAGYAFYVDEARYMGDSLKAEGLQIEKWASDQLAGINDQVAQAEAALREARQRVEKAQASKRGATPEAIAAVKDAEDRITEIKAIAAEKQYLTHQHLALKTRKSLRDDHLAVQRNLADIAVEYAQLSGTVVDVRKAETASLQVELDERLSKVVAFSEEWYAISKLYAEKIRQSQIMATGSFGEGFSLGLTQAAEGIQTIGELGNESAKTLYAGFKDVFKGIATGADDMGDRVANMLDNLADKFLDFAFNSMWNSMFSGMGSGVGGMGGGFDLGGLLNGIFGGWSGTGSLHTGGQVGIQGSSRSVSPLNFVNARRFHDGLKPGEFPTILKYGEDVRTPDQRRRDEAEKQGSREVFVTNNFHFPPGTDVNSFRRSQTQIAADMNRAARKAERNL